MVNTVCRVKTFSGQYFKKKNIFPRKFCYFSQKIRFDSSCKLSPKETFFLEKIRKNITDLSSAEFAHRGKE